MLNHCATSRYMLAILLPEHLTKNAAREVDGKCVKLTLTSSTLSASPMESFVNADPLAGNRQERPVGPRKKPALKLPLPYAGPL